MLLTLDIYFAPLVTLTKVIVKLGFIRCLSISLRLKCETHTTTYFLRLSLKFFLQRIFSLPSLKGN